MAIDWRDQTHEHRVRYQMVSQTNLDDVWGELGGVDPSGSSIEAAYYTDTRTSGKLSVYGEHWIRGSFIRVTDEIPDLGYSRELGTYIVTKDDASLEGGIWHYDLELHSMLKGLSEDRLTQPWSIAKGASALDCMKGVLLGSGMHSMRKVLGILDHPGDAQVEVDDSLAEDVRATTAQIMQAGRSRLECLYALAKMSHNRVDVNPHGNIVVAKRVSPGSRSPKFRIDLADERGVSLYGTLSRSSDWLELPDVVAIEHKYTDKSGKKSEQRTVYGEARLSSSHARSTARRGYSVVSFESVKEMAPKTAQRAHEMAKQRLAEQSTELVEWELQTVYLPLWEGDVVELVVHDGDPRYQGVRKCLVKQVEIELQHMTMRLTLKETASGDKGDEE